MMRINRLAVGVLFATAAMLLSPTFASAHEHRDIGDGRYSVVVGFIDEPAITGFKNGLSLTVADHSMVTPATDGGEETAAPVEGLEATLQAEIIFGDQKMTLVLEPKWRTPGAYEAWVVPMAPGDYTFRIFGTIGDLAVDETFTAGPDTFSSVQDQAEIQFPKAAESASTNAPVFGAVTGGGTDFGAIGGAAAGIALGAAGLYLILRRRQSVALKPVVVRAGAGD